MNEFTTLRERARRKRDDVIEKARQDYEKTLANIAKLEQQLTGVRDPRGRTISSCIESVIPSDREFTTVDVMTALEALDPRRAWRKRAVDNHINYLRSRGLVKRLVRSRKGEPAKYIRGDIPTEKKPFENMTLLEVVTQVLGNRSMTATELTVAILEAGYETAMCNKTFRDAIGTVMRKDGRFMKEGDKWLIQK